jgi:hypothetical protein
MAERHLCSSFEAGSQTFCLKILAVMVQAARARHEAGKGLSSLYSRASSSRYLAKLVSLGEKASSWASSCSSIRGQV